MWKHLSSATTTLNLPLPSLLSAFLAAACSLAVDPARPQCTTSLDCSSALAGSACVDALCETKPEWTCLASGESATESVSDQRALREGTLEVTLPTLDMIGREPVADLVGSVCQKLDVNCAAPLAQVNSDAAGNFSLVLDPSFDGYIQLDDASRVPVLYFVGPLTPGETLPPLTLLDPSSMSALVSEVDAELRANHGIALFTTQDCLGGYSEGIRYQSANADADTVAFYAADGLPSIAAAATDATGYGGFINLPAGAAQVTGWFAAGAQPLASTSVLIRERSITQGRITPVAPSRAPL